MAAPLPAFHFPNMPQQQHQPKSPKSPKPIIPNPLLGASNSFQFGNNNHVPSFSTTQESRAPLGILHTNVATPPKPPTTPGPPPKASLSLGGFAGVEPARFASPAPIRTSGTNQKLTITPNKSLTSPTPPLGSPKLLAPPSQTTTATTTTLTDHYVVMFGFDPQQQQQQQYVLDYLTGLGRLQIVRQDSNWMLVHYESMISAERASRLQVVPLGGRLCGVCRPSASLVSSILRSGRSGSTSSNGWMDDDASSTLGGGGISTTDNDSGTVVPTTGGRHLMMMSSSSSSSKLEESDILLGSSGRRRMGENGTMNGGSAMRNGAIGEQQQRSICTKLLYWYFGWDQQDGEEESVAYSHVAGSWMKDKSA